MLAIVEDIRLWRPYLLNKKFFILTDQRSLKFFLEQRVATPEQQKCAAKLLGYDYEILYRPGKENSTADALSRRAESPMIHDVHLATVSIWDEIIVSSTNDAYIVAMKAQAMENPQGSFSWRQGLLFYKDRVVVPANSVICSNLLHEFHDSKLGGHSGVLRTYKELEQQFY